MHLKKIEVGVQHVALVFDQYKFRVFWLIRHAFNTPNVSYIGFISVGEIYCQKSLMISNIGYWVLSILTVTRLNRSLL